MSIQPPIVVKPLFGPLDDLLLDLLKGLSDQDWEKQTIAKAWKVKDVAAHLLDGNLKTLSIQRDGYFGEIAPEKPTYGTLVEWLNELNASWVKAAKRISPKVLIHLLEITGKEVTAYYETLPDYEKAVFPVNWAGETQSQNWMHLAREYTEKWHHQQQIRDAVEVPGIMNKEFYLPVLDTFMKALPFTFSQMKAGKNDMVKISVTGTVESTWYLSKITSGWHVGKTEMQQPTATVEIDADWAWKLFSKSLRSHDIMDRVKISGEERLALRVLEMVSVMA
ncbi:maleylpyruvate isomerase N-terminal domain-containing protein [Pararhodonellum marinum]|uniref:maleylpyruvate isomerase N-terminal domain-containing protein n=1 Tax=Pararhodonellum marinum TaxID=2755358 RepID=UPI0018909BCB|nr:maleylpyruvate isomerase N-terminal domain-containing protein [Pararhodonellum marinum]